jgi:hypothetical protein
MARRVHYFVCENKDCNYQIEVAPLETSGYRAISCPRCYKDYSVLNSELKVKEVSDADVAAAIEVYHCFKCGTPMLLVAPAKRKCPTCGEEGGEVVPPELFREHLNAGVYYNIDPNTGKRAKTKR